MGYGDVYANPSALWSLLLICKANRGIDVPALECNNDILFNTSSRSVTTLSYTSHSFHRFCIEKHLLATIPSACPFPTFTREIRNHLD
ncbi:hypothetical protein RhiirA5_427473 [Rhizophagus irregularis]|uniref:Uncharacterized protein n=1 Tax=Rhizophagus irregularis TaxID=588596 RepID=A0A2N0P2B4_9GLOM|nr:hypothetical protein RhiirA5_427473 [Rhizophagus irregularis]